MTVWDVVEDLKPPMRSPSSGTISLRKSAGLVLLGRAPHAGGGQDRTRASPDLLLLYFSRPAVGVSVFGRHMHRLGLWGVLAGWGVLNCWTLVSGSSVDSDLTLTVAASGCTAFELNGLPQKFGYSLTVEAWTLGTCAASSVR